MGNRVKRHNRHNPHVGGKVTHQAKWFKPRPRDHHDTPTHSLIIYAKPDNLRRGTTAVLGEYSPGGKVTILRRVVMLNDVGDVRAGAELPRMIRELVPPGSRLIAVGMDDPDEELWEENPESRKLREEAHAKAALDEAGIHAVILS